jgi:hypothetical protein
MTDILDAKRFLHKIIDVTCFRTGVGNAPLKEDHWNLEKMQPVCPDIIELKKLNLWQEPLGFLKKISTLTS